MDWLRKFTLWVYRSLKALISSKSKAINANVRDASPIITGDHNRTKVLSQPISVAGSESTKIGRQVADALVAHQPIVAGQSVTVYITMYFGVPGTSAGSASASLPGPTVKENEDA
jgi:hypothetical protein